MKKTNNKNLLIGKIKEKIEKVEVRGQGCWDDCYISGYWINRKSSNTYGCDWIGPRKTPYNNIFS